MAKIRLKINGGFYGDTYSSLLNIANSLNREFSKIPTTNTNRLKVVLPTRSSDEKMIKSFTSEVNRSLSLISAIDQSKKLRIGGLFSKDIKIAITSIINEINREIGKLDITI